MAQNYLTHLWSALAQALADCPFQPNQPQRHCTAPLRLLGRWDAVRQAIEAETGWREQSDLLQQHAVACESLRDNRAALEDWYLICERGDPEAESHLANSEMLGDAWAEFADAEPPIALALFPAWCVLRGRAAFTPLNQFVAVALRAALALRQDRSNIALRRSLLDVAPELMPFALAMRE